MAWLVYSQWTGTTGTIVGGKWDRFALNLVMITDGLACDEMHDDMSLVFTSLFSCIEKHTGFG